MNRLEEEDGIELDFSFGVRVLFQVLLTVNR